MDKTYFNSYVSRDDYAIVRDEAYRLGVTVKVHISTIVSAYAEQKRKEERCGDSKAKRNR